MRLSCVPTDAARNPSPLSAAAPCVPQHPQQYPAPDHDTPGARMKEAMKVQCSVVNMACASLLQLMQYAFGNKALVLLPIPSGLLCVSFGLAGLDADFISVRMLLLQMAGNITAAQLAQTQVS